MKQDAVMEPMKMSSWFTPTLKTLTCNLKQMPYFLCLAINTLHGTNNLAAEMLYAYNKLCGKVKYRVWISQK